MSQDKLALIRQSLAAAESSIKTAKQLLSELETGGMKPSAKDLPGETGVFDGINMITTSGDSFPVPTNYASKSLLVIGDTLKLVDEDGEKRFKQIEHVKRLKTTGILHKKDGKFKVITPEGSYNVLEASIEHFKGEVGDEVVLQLPAGNMTASFGAVEAINKKAVPEAEESDTKVPDPKPTPKLSPKPEAPKADPKPAPRPVPKPAFKPAPVRPVEKKPTPAPAAPVVLGDDDLR